MPPLVLTVPPFIVPPATFHVPVVASRFRAVLLSVPVMLTVPAVLGLRVNVPISALAKVPPKLRMPPVTLIVPELCQVPPILKVPPVTAQVAPDWLLNVEPDISVMPPPVGSVKVLRWFQVP